MATKRPLPTSSSSLVKRTRVHDEDDGDAASSSLVPIASSKDGKDKGLVLSVKRTSALDHPIISLGGGHQGDILDVRFSHDGQYIAAAGGDKTVSIWKTYAPNNHVTSLVSHSKAVTCLAFLPAPSSLNASSPQLITGSADGTLILWFILSPPPHNKTRRFRYHRSIVNCVSPSPSSSSSLFASGSDDGNVCIWHVDDKQPQETLRVGYPVTALEWTRDGSGLFVGGVDNAVHLYDLHRKTVLYSLRGHADTITCLRLSPSGSFLLSFALESQCRVWDVRPFAVAKQGGGGGMIPDGAADGDAAATEERLYKTLAGAVVGAESLLIRGNWSPDGKRIILGSGDRTCVVWDVESSKILYKLPGHRGTCTAADYHPREPIVVSSSTDGQLLLGEIEP